jgi:RHS repeat-associated protein
VAGATTTNASSVTVNTLTADRYADNTFARAGFTLADGNNTFTAVATDALSRGDTNSITVNLPATVTFLYDLNGNLRTNGTRVLDYDVENQLTRVTEPSAWKAEFSYDGKMRMCISKDYAWRNGAWVLTNEVHRVYNGMLVLQERDQFNVPKLTYTRGKDLSGSLEGAGGIGGLLALSEMSNLSSPIHSYFHADGNGNVTALVDTNQNVVARYLFDPFGNTLSATGPKAEINKYRFSSKEAQSQSGLVYYGYRFYEPSLQRWPNRDPIQEQPGRFTKRKYRDQTKAGWNLFTFCFNDPNDRAEVNGKASFSHIGSEFFTFMGQGGKCCNKGPNNEFWLDNGTWKPLGPGQCTGLFDDCDGMTCAGGFGNNSGMNASTTCDSKCETIFGGSRRDDPGWKPGSLGTPPNPGRYDEGEPPPGYVWAM